MDCKPLGHQELSIRWQDDLRLEQVTYSVLQFVVGGKSRIH